MRPAVAARPGAGDAELEAHASLAAHQLGEAVLLLAGNIELLAGRTPVPAYVADALRGLTVGTERTRRYVDDLLDVLASRAEAVEPARLDLGAEFGRARADLSDAFAHARAELDLSPLPAVALDPSLGGRLCAHLLRGALAAAGPRGLRIAVGGARRGATVRVEVSDDGEPLPAEAGAALFAAFAAPRGRGPLVGAGVSAAVCRRVVEAHGGTIEARPSEGGGAVVALTLPAG